MLRIAATNVRGKINTALICAALALLLAGCTSGPDDKGFVGNLAAATAEDAAIAWQLAISANPPDMAAARCWDTVGKAAAKRAGRVKIEGGGTLAKWQRLRNARRKLQDGLDGQVRADCAVLVLDALRTARKVVGRVLPIF